MSEPHERETEALRKQIRVLSRRLERSELNRARLEEFKDKSVALYRGIIQEMNESQRRLEESERHAQEANKAKSTFLANMGHELRTPLNAIIGYTELLLEEGDDLSETQREDLGTILTASDHLRQLIDSVLDLSKIEADRLDICMEDINLGELVFDVVGTARPGVEARGNRFVIDCGCEGLEMRSDRLRLVQILLNLLSNAGKFCGAGVVTLRTRPTADEVLFVVEDTGIGMTEEQLSRVFEPFVQADASTTRRYGGTGLGLSVARRFAELLGGALLATSELGAGSRFALTLPRSPSAGASG